MLEFDPAPPTVKQRVVAAIVTALVVIPAVNYYADFKWFDGYDKQVSGIAVLIGLIWFMRFAPSVKQKDR
jgi:uncharacterized membrane protein YphA (DoxX/SURF4 family)